MPRFWGICCAMSMSASIILSGAVAQTVKDVAINGVHLPYVEQGVGEPIVFVHGLISDLRTWDPVKERIAQKYRFVAYTQRYFGTAPWNDEGKAFSISTLADDLVKFIVSLNAGPVHLVAWSYGGQPATLAATQNPSLVRSLILYEPSVMSVLPETSTEGKIARADRAKMVASSVAASKSGDASKSGRLLAEAVFRLAPGDSSHEPDAWQRMWEENGRVNSLAFAAAPSPVTCDTFKSFSKPTLLMRGETTYLAYQLINNEISRCVPGAKQVILANVNHDGPIRDPEGFTAAIFEFLSNQSR